MLQFRSLDGSENNLSNPTMNSTGSAMARIAPANFAPLSTSTPVGGPNAREISNVVASGPQAEAHDPSGLSAMMYVWGQFIDHDLDHTLPDGTNHIDITIPPGDPNFAAGSTIPLTRFTTDPTTGTTVNSVTGWLDASMIYGSDDATAATLRLPDGHMKTSADGNLPIVNGAYAAGDSRATENPDLTAITTLFVREHNYQVDQLKQQHLEWSGDQLYQTARAIVTAEIENITYTEFLPHLLGPNSITPYQGYNPSADPRITEEFADAAYRFGHSIVSGTESKLDNQGNQLQSQSLAQAFFDTTDQVQANGGIDALLRGILSDQSQANDVYAVDELRNLLAASPDQMDLIAIDIQRERDVGLGTLNQTRIALGLQPYDSFNQITSDPAVAAHLQQVFGSVDNVDLFIGGLAEDHLPGAMVGSTFDAIIAQQFENLRDGDRLWWQNQGFDPATAAQIANTTLSDIIERNTDTTVAQADAFVAADRHGSDIAAEDPTAAQLVIGVNADNATISGGPADDTIVAGLGQNQQLTGGGGSDVFVFSASNLHDTITDFSPADDKLQFTMSAHDFSISAAPDGHATVTYDGSTIDLPGVLPRQLTHSDFILPSGSGPETHIGRGDGGHHFG
ncbi:MAG TPA: peroxidase family protein [Acetobacteraceae bacterium]|nr:peroxidase family protein [Acetobacteraceae bacterium]